MIRVFKSQIIQQQLNEAELIQLAADFRLYKETGIPTPFFGRDAPYDHSYNLASVRAECLMHLHLAEDGGRWLKQGAQYSRTSESHLVYCQGYFSADHYLLMAVLRPDAHTQARDNNTMIRLAAMAAKFHAKF